MVKEQESAAERAVAQYEGAREELDVFLNDPDIRDILLELDQRVQGYNEALDKANRAVKTELRASEHDKLIIGAIGAQKKYRRWYDADFLAAALPADQFEAILLEEKVVYKLDLDRLEQLSRQGEIDTELVAKSYHEQEQNPASLPGTPKPYNPPPLPVLDE